MALTIAFLRAINVGGHVVKMDRLRALFSEMGFSRVTTFIASGNVIFETDSQDVATIERQIEAHLQTALGYQVGAFVRTTVQLAALAAHTPFPTEETDAEGASMYLAFLREPLPNSARERLLALRGEFNELHVHGREIYWLCRMRMTDSPVFKGGGFEKAIGCQTTMRNITTVRKLAALYCE